MTPLFPSLFQAVAFWAILAIVLAAGLTWTVSQLKTEGKRRNDFYSLTVLGVGVLIAIGYARIGVLPNWLFYPGETLIVVGVLFTLWSYSVLGRYLSPYVQVLPDHKVIEGGPYRYVRHPGYLGQMVVWIGLGLAMQSYVALVAALILGGSLVAYRIRIEEAFMAAQLGEPYLDYMARTKRLLPFVW